MPRNNVPNGAIIGHFEGRVDPAKEMNLTIALKLHNQAEYDQAYEDLIDPASPRYHQWFTPADFEKYAPTPAEFETVKNELIRRGFTVISESPLRLTIRVHGTAAVIENAFHTELDTFSYSGRTFQAHSRDARLDGPAGDLIEGVSGLERHEARPAISVVRNPKTGKPVVWKELSSKERESSFLNSFTDTPLSVSATISLNSFGNPPDAVYVGMEYAAKGQTGGLTPAQLQAHYGIPFPQDNKTYDGTGETIALVEGYGYPQAEADANTAASLFNLPKLTASTFKVVYPEGKPLDPNAGELTGWDGEIALDIQSAHAIAPGAKILVVASSGQDNEDQLYSLGYVIAPARNAAPLANAVSDSWENDSEIIAGILEEEAFNAVLSAGAHAGVSFQFSSGDSGDHGLGSPLGSVGVPSNSPYVTAVGGTSILNNPYATGSQSPWIVTGWGNDAVDLYSDFVEDPAFAYFDGGAGGGESLYFAKPSWQKRIIGAGRMVPDIAALADPFTGFPVVISEGANQYGEIVGGTSLASPIMTAIWAVADQYNGGALGQAAPLINKLNASQVNDVVPPTTAEETHDVAGSITDSKGTRSFNRTTIFTKATDLDTGGSFTLYNQTAFISAIWPGGVFGLTGSYAAVSFGTDTSLTITSGWDYATGWGEPNGIAFVQGVTGKTTGAGKDKE